MPRGVERDQPAVVDDGHAFTQRLGLLHEVGHQHDRGAAVPDAPDQPPGLPPRGGVERRGQLVEEHHLGFTQQGQGEEQALALPARQRPEGAPPQPSQLPCVEHGVDVSAMPLCASEQADRLCHSEPVGQCRRLQLCPDPVPQLVGVACRVEPEHLDVPAVAGAQSLQALHGGGLAGPVGAEDAEDLPAPNGETTGP